MRGRGSARTRCKNSSWNSSCTTPAINTPQASASPALPSTGASYRAAAIRHGFNNTGVKAGTAKRPWVFSTPAASATRDINAR